MRVADPKFNPSGNPVITEIKTKANELAEYIEANVEPGRRRQLALTNIENASMWAVKEAVSGDG